MNYVGLFQTEEIFSFWSWGHYGKDFFIAMWNSVFGESTTLKTSFYPIFLLLIFLLYLFLSNGLVCLGWALCYWRCCLKSLNAGSQAIKGIFKGNRLFQSKCSLLLQEPECFCSLFIPAHFWYPLQSFITGWIQAHNLGILSGLAGMVYIVLSETGDGASQPVFSLCIALVPYQSAAVAECKSQYWKLFIVSFGEGQVP